jgi:hypothetical protein
VTKGGFGPPLSSDVRQHETLRFPQQEIFQDEVGLTSGKWCSAGETSYRAVNCFGPSLGFDQLIKRVQFGQLKRTHTPPPVFASNKTSRGRLARWTMVILSSLNSHRYNHHSAKRGGSRRHTRTKRQDAMWRRGARREAETLNVVARHRYLHHLDRAPRQ